MIGNDTTALVRTARELQKHPVAAIDLNLGCPVPIVYRKCAGGGLLRDPARIDQILGALREAVEIPFTVKTRSASTMRTFSRSCCRSSPELGRPGDGARTHGEGDVSQRAALRVHRARGRRAAVSGVRQRQHLLSRQGGRSAGAHRRTRTHDRPRCHSESLALRQIREQRRGEPIFRPTGRDVLDYVRALWDAVSLGGTRESAQVNNMKKYMNFIGLGVEPTGEFLHRIAASRASVSSSPCARSSSCTTKRCRSSLSRSR
jgi:hypothetical protein